MTSFRRSFIYVDLLMRKKKKKDKRRNTVAEGETKDLKDVFNIFNEESQYKSVANIYTCPTIKNCSDDDKTFLHELQTGNKVQNSTTDEKNNNSTDEKSFHKLNFINSTTTNDLAENQSKNSLLRKDALKNNINSDSIPKVLPLNKKSKSNIPISTTSAAMNVAVEMRQLNGSEKDEPSSESNRNSYSISSPSSSCDEESSSSKHCRIYKERMKRSLEMKKTNGGNNLSRNNYSEESEALSSSSSENNHRGTDTSSFTKSIESDSSEAFFIDSDDSDDNLSDATDLQERYELSTSLSTISDGSLNSLLSQTGTEMTSSTGTLTSVGHEQLPSPSIIVKVSKNSPVKKTTVRVSSSEKRDNKISSQVIKDTAPAKTSNKVPKSSPKYSKAAEKESQRNISATENSKNLFTTLINKKPNAKEQQRSKLKDCKNKLIKNETRPLFDVYGNQSPKKLKQIPTFIKENISPEWEDVPKQHFQSFHPCQPKTNTNADASENTKPNTIIPQNQPHAYETQHFTTNSTPTVSTQATNNVPLKYVHQVTVNPIKRDAVQVNKINNTPPNQYQDHHKQGSALSHGYAPRRPTTFCCNGTNNEMSTFLPPNIQRHYQHHRQMQNGRPVARVVLDPEGRVIYSTNSLDRNHHTQFNNSTPNRSFRPSPTFVEENNNVAPHSSGVVRHEALHIPSKVMEQNYYRSPPTPTFVRECTPIPVESYAAYRDYSSSETNTHCVIGDDKQRYNYSTVHEIGETKIKLSPASPGERRFHGKTVGNHTFDYQKCPSETEMSSQCFLRLPPDPNIPGLPAVLPQNDLKPSKTTNHQKYSEGFNTFPRMINSTTNKNLINQAADKTNQSTLSTDDLFAVIYKCKKRMNIKTDADVSPVSPSVAITLSNVSSTTKGNLVETGFLSPRNVSGDRKSWADFRPVNGSPTEYRSSANDRLGPTKPTSMHDFKMLLLQTRSNSQTSRPRKSAVEMLKVPLSQSNNSLSLNLSPRNSLSLSPGSPSSQTSFCFEHSTIPFKRGNRGFASLHSRCRLYPPIFEDGSEETENNCNMQQNNSL